MNSEYKVNLAVGLTLASMLSIILLWIFCVNWISPGYVGVVVNSWGGQKGVEDQELTVGLNFTAPWKKVYTFPVFEQNHEWVGKEGFGFQTSEGLSVHADIGINFNLQPNKIHELFCKYRRGMDEITHLFIKNNIRDAINRVSSKMKIEDLIGAKKDEFFDLVQKNVNEELRLIGFNISHIFVVGNFHVPELVLTALNKKIEATQRAQQRENELRESEAQAKKEIALADGFGRSEIIRAKAASEANKIITSSINSDLLKWEAIKKWNGKLPDAITSDNAGFLIDLKKENK